MAKFRRVAAKGNNNVVSVKTESSVLGSTPVPFISTAEQESFSETPGVMMSEMHGRLSAALLTDSSNTDTRDSVTGAKRILDCIERGDFRQAEAIAIEAYQKAKNSGDANLFFNICCTAANTNLATGNFGAAKNFAEIALKLAIKYNSEQALYMSQGYLTKATYYKDGLGAAKIYLSNWFRKQSDKRAAAEGMSQELCKPDGKNKLPAELLEFWVDIAVQQEGNPKNVLEIKLKAARKLENPEKSREIAEQLLQIDPKNEDAGEAFLLAGIFNEDEVNAATKDFALATLAKQPDNATAKLVMAYYFLLNEKQGKEAYRLAERLYLSGFYRMRAMCIMCNSSLLNGDHIQARETAIELLSEEPENICGLNTLMHLHLLNEEWEEVIVLLDKLIKLDSDFPANYSMLAKAHCALGHDQEALAAAKHYVSSFDDNLQENTSVMFTLYNLGEFTLAGVVAEKLLRRIPDFPDALRVMLYIYCNIETKKAEALNFARKLQETDPDDISVLRISVGLYFNSGLIDESEKTARYYRLIAPTDPIALELLIQVCVFLKKNQEAEDLLLELTKLAPENEKLQHLRELILRKEDEEKLASDLPTIILPVRNRKRKVNGEGKKTAPKPADEVTRAKTVLANETHKITLEKWQKLLRNTSDCCLRVGKNDRGFDSAHMRKDQVLLAEVKSINTSHDNERDEIVRALGQLNLYELAYIRGIPECAGKQIKRVIVLSHRPKFPEQKESDVYQAMAVAEKENLYYVLWFEDGELKGSTAAIEAYEDYLTH